MQGLGDLAAHLVAFHNMGASPSHDDPFVSGVRVDFHSEAHQGGEGEGSPHSQTRNAGSLVDRDHAFDGSDRVRPCHMGANVLFCCITRMPYSSSFSCHFRGIECLCQQDLLGMRAVGSVNEERAVQCRRRLWVWRRERGKCLLKLIR